ncbi:MAG: tRNA (adenosine(37)-N6)-threonylcarbamoyltransferase complex ATPase subunit type 1 TsaE [Bacteroidota bacterium]|nr:tRNA (adenosine(37)-N6)-threonylcarbamoyltransferase complex ATPase subunit type 1 TsaE [Bacteroidota bacterium]
MTLTYNLDQIDQAAEFIIQNSPHKVLLFDAAMGTGKTTLIRQLTKRLNVIDQVVSPTFSIINQYQTSDNKPIYHFDFYRIKHLEEALSIGAIDYLESGNWCFIEWGENVMQIIPTPHTLVRINITENNFRNIQITHIE